MSWSNKLTGAPVSPVNAQYQALTLAANTQLHWPLETTEGVPYVAAQIDVTANAVGLSLLMPDATQASPGNVTSVTNTGSNSFTLADSTGTAIQVIAAGQTFIITMTGNATAAGTWRTTLLGSTTTNANAATLAGYGLQASGATLQLSYPVSSLSANQTVTAGFRANQIVWTGATGTLQLDAAATLTAGWWALATNQGTGPLTISTSGSDLINGNASIVIPEGSAGQFYSALVGCTGTGFVTFGNVPSPTAIADGGTGATTAPAALTNLGGSAIGQTIFTAPNAAAVRAALGISTTTFNLVPTSSSVGVGSGDGGNVYECSAAVILTLAATAGLGTSFFFCVNAQGGSVTLTPNAGDSINGQTAGANYIVPQGSSGMLVTNGAGNWWPIFLEQGTTNLAGPWIVAGGTVDAITVTNLPARGIPADGEIQCFRASGANTSTTPTLSRDGSTARAVVKSGGVALVPGDIPGALAECYCRYNLANTRWELLNPAFPGSPQLQFQKFVANGTFTVPANATTKTVFKITAAGGGGAGGGASTGGQACGSGGGSGGARTAWFKGFNPGDSVAVVIGGGGGGGSGNGAPGGNTTVSYSAVAIVSANGGGGGPFGTPPGAGGAAGTSSATAIGTTLTLVDSVSAGAAPGANGIYLATALAVTWGGGGGSNSIGTGGNPTYSGATQQAGNAGTDGAGGSGGASTTGGGAANGGNGGTGFAIFEWVG